MSNLGKINLNDNYYYDFDDFLAFLQFTLMPHSILPNSSGNGRFKPFPTITKPIALALAYLYVPYPTAPTTTSQSPDPATNTPEPLTATFQLFNQFHTHWSLENLVVTVTTSTSDENVDKVREMLKPYECTLEEKGTVYGREMMTRRIEFR